MATLLVKHKVNDYAKWKAVYDQVKPMVKSKGGKRQRLLKSSSDPNDLVVLTEFDSVGAAQQFANAQELRQAMQQAGVAGSAGWCWQFGQDFGMVQFAEHVGIAWHQHANINTEFAQGRR